MHTLAQLFLVMVGVLLADQLVKEGVRSLLAGRQVPLGFLGCVRAVEGRLWLSRVGRPPGVVRVWMLWGVAALSLLTGTLLLLPQAAVFTGLILGGSLSHVLEHMRRGCITDYICLRFWPAFNLADAAITAGSLGMAWAVWTAVALPGAS